MAETPKLAPEATDIFGRLKASGRNQRELAEALGIDQNKVTKVKTGERRLTAGEVLKAREWLDGLRDPPSASPSMAHEPDQPVTRSADAGDTVGILQLDLSLSMGPGTLIQDFVESEIVSFDASVLKRITRTPSDCLRFVTGIGTSHEPKFQSGDQFLVDINENKLSRLDGYYWITFDGAHALKRLRPLGNGMVQIVSENPDFAPMDVDRDAIRIEGRAVWFARGL